MKRAAPTPMDGAEFVLDFMDERIGEMVALASAPLDWDQQCCYLVNTYPVIITDMASFLDPEPYDQERCGLRENFGNEPACIEEDPDDYCHDGGPPAGSGFGAREEQQNLHARAWTGVLSSHWSLNPVKLAYDNRQPYPPRTPG